MLLRQNRCPRAASGTGARRFCRRTSAFLPGKWEYAPLATQIGKELQEQLLAASPSFPDSLSEAMYRPADTSLSEESEGNDEQVPFMEARVLLSSDLALLHIIHGLKQRGIILTPTIAGRVKPPDTELEPLHRPLREARLLQDATDWVDLFVASLLEISASSGGGQRGKNPVVHQISKYHLAFTYALNISYGWNLEGLAQRYRLDSLLSGFSGIATALGSDGHPDADSDAGNSNRSVSSDRAGQGEATASPEREQADMAWYKREVSELQPSLTSLSCTGSLPAIRSVERHCTAVFGDMDVLTERWRRYAAKAMTESGTATEQAKMEMQEGITSGSLECVELTEQALRRVLFEAVCFGMELHVADNRLSACGQVGARNDRAWEWAKRLFG